MQFSGKEKVFPHKHYLSSVKQAIDKIIRLRNDIRVFF